jgi:hypothetical protein
MGCILSFQWYYVTYFGLCTKRFNLFRSLDALYSCYLMILVIFNLPLGMCMGLEFMFLSTVIYGPNNPNMNIDICHL